MRRVIGTAVAAAGILVLPLSLPAQAAEGAIVIDGKHYTDLDCIRVHDGQKVENYTDGTIGFWADTQCEPHSRPQEKLSSGATGYIAKNSKIRSVGFYKS